MVAVVMRQIYYVCDHQYRFWSDKKIDFPKSEILDIAFELKISNLWK